MRKWTLLVDCWPSEVIDEGREASLERAQLAAQAAMTREGCGMLVCVSLQVVSSVQLPSGS